MNLAAYGCLILAWATWLTPFVRMKRPATAEQVDPRARVGVALQSLAYWLLFFNPFWRRDIEGLRLALSVVFAAVGCSLAVTALSSLGKHWRIDAGLNADHELIQSGPYKFVRHPIYLSMFCMLIATGCVVAPVPFLVASMLIFLTGTEIRVRIEDSLLASRFNQDFGRYHHSVRAYIPFVR